MSEFLEPDWTRIRSRKVGQEVAPSLLPYDARPVEGSIAAAKLAVMEAISSLSSPGLPPNPKLAERIASEGYTPDVEAALDDHCLQPREYWVWDYHLTLRLKKQGHSHAALLWGIFELAKEGVWRESVEYAAGWTLADGQTSLSFIRQLCAPVAAVDAWFRRQDSHRDAKVESVEEYTAKHAETAGGAPPPEAEPAKPAAAAEGEAGGAGDAPGYLGIVIADDPPRVSRLNHEGAVDFSGKPALWVTLRLLVEGGVAGATHADLASADGRKVEGETVRSHIGTLKRMLGRLGLTVESVRGYGYRIVPLNDPTKVQQTFNEDHPDST